MGLILNILSIKYENSSKLNRDLDYIWKNIKNNYLDDQYEMINKNDDSLDTSGNLDNSNLKNRLFIDDEKKILLDKNLPKINYFIPEEEDEYYD